jgi:MFS family permease
MSAGELVSSIGSGLSAFALGIWVYRQTGSVTGFAMTFMATHLPTILLLPFSGALVDRWDLRRTLLAANMVGMLNMVVVAALMARGALTSYHVYAAIGVNAILTAFQWPAYSATTSMLVPGQQLGRAAGLAQFTRALTEVAAPLLGALLLPIIDLDGVVAVDVMTFLAALLALLVIRVPARTRHGAGARGRLGQEIRFAWRHLLDRPGLVALLVFFSLINVSGPMALVLVAPFVLSFAGVTELGWTMSFGGLGMLAGGVAMSLWGGPRRHMLGVIGAALLMALSLPVIGARPWLPAVALGLFGFNLAVPIMNGCSQALWQRKVPPALQGRIFAFRRMFATASVPVVYLSAGPLADHVFEPLLRADGALAGTVGLLIGTGPGRGMGFMYVLLGVFTTALVVVAWSTPRLMNVQEDLPDASDMGKAIAQPTAQAVRDLPTAASQLEGEHAIVEAS